MTFDALEAIERNSDSINKLTSLVSKMNMKMDKHETQYKPQVYHGRKRGKIGVNIGKMVIKPEIGYTVEIGIHHIEAEEIMTEILDQTIGVDLGIIIDGKDTDKVIGMTISDKITEGTAIEIFINKIMDKAIIKNNGIEVQVGTVIEITTETIQGTDLSKVEMQIEIGVEKDSQDHGLEWNQKVEETVIDQEQNQDLDQVQELVQTEIGLGVISADSMIILPRNAPVPLPMKIQMV